MAEVLKNKIRKINEFIRRLQRLDNSEKKKWLIGLTTLAMLIFIGLWGIYLNTVGLPTITRPKPIAAAPVAPAQPAEESFWQIFQRGWQEVSEQVKNTIGQAEKAIGEQVAKSNEIILNNSTSAPTLIATTTVNATATQQ